MGMSQQPTITHTQRQLNQDKPNMTVALLVLLWRNINVPKLLWDKFRLSTARIVFGQFVARKELLYANSCRHSDSMSPCLHRWSSISEIRLMPSLMCILVYTDACNSDTHTHSMAYWEAQQHNSLGRLSMTALWDIQQWVHLHCKLNPHPYASAVLSYRPGTGKVCSLRMSWASWCLCHESSFNFSPLPHNSLSFHSRSWGSQKVSRSQQAFCRVS